MMAEAPIIVDILNNLVHKGEKVSIYFEGASGVERWLTDVRDDFSDPESPLGIHPRKLPCMNFHFTGRLGSYFRSVPTTDIDRQVFLQRADNPEEPWLLTILADTKPL